MTDREICALLGHVIMGVHAWETGGFYYLCTCHSRKGMKPPSYHKEYSAIEAAVFHLRTQATRFRDEARNAGLTLEEAAQRWNGKRRTHSGGTARS